MVRGKRPEAIADERVSNRRNANMRRLQLIVGSVLDLAEARSTGKSCESRPGFPEIEKLIVDKLTWYLKTHCLLRHCKVLSQHSLAATGAILTSEGLAAW